MAATFLPIQTNLLKSYYSDGLCQIGSQQLKKESPGTQVGGIVCYITPISVLLESIGENRPNCCITTSSGLPEKMSVPNTKSTHTQNVQTCSLPEEWYSIQKHVSHEQQIGYPYNSSTTTTTTTATATATPPPPPPPPPRHRHRHPHQQPPTTTNANPTLNNCKQCSVREGKFDPGILLGPLKLLGGGGLST